MDKTYSHTAELAVAVAQNPEMEAQIKANPVAALASLADPLRQDKWIYRMVVGALGLVVLIAIVGAIILAGKGDQATTAFNLLTALGSAAIGALAGLLSPSPREK